MISLIRSKIIRIYPTKEQEQILWKHINCSRYIWNYMLAYQKERYENGEKHLSKFGMNKYLTTVKNDGEHQWLYEISNTTLQAVCGDLAEAYQRFFKKISGFPKFKSKKKAKASFPVGSNYIYFLENIVHIPKLDKVKYKTDYTIPLSKDVKLFNPRITYTANKKWILTVGFECENQTPELTDNLMGIDLGIKELAVISYGNECLKFGNINKSKKMKNLESKLKHLQRNLSRKYKQNDSYEETKNIRKDIEKIKRLYHHISNIRKNYLHQTTHKLVSLLPERVVMEDLNVNGMMKNKHLSKAIQNQCFYEFRRQMTYKCEERGIEIVFANRFFPSSKTCSNCGSYKKNLKLSDRVFVCEDCGIKIDRDYNAAINLMNYRVLF